jgi:hypothetical protein
MDTALLALKQEFTILKMRLNNYTKLMLKMRLENFGMLGYYLTEISRMKLVRTVMKFFHKAVMKKNISKISKSKSRQKLRKTGNRCR